VLPLGLYLLTFILAFDAPRWYRRTPLLCLAVPALGGMAYMQWPKSKELDLRLTVGLFALALFVCCMVFHGELARRKPSPRHLTGFYLLVAAGGALGGMFVGLAAPLLFDTGLESCP
jgi:hypothetical protein